MRVYYVETRNTRGVWVKGNRRFDNNRKAHSAARHGPQPARVFMHMEESKIKLPKAA